MSLIFFMFYERLEIVLLTEKCFLGYFKTFNAFHNCAFVVIVSL